MSLVFCIEDISPDELAEVFSLFPFKFNISCAGQEL